MVPSLNRGEILRSLYPGHRQFIKTFSSATSADLHARSSLRILILNLPETRCVVIYPDRCILSTYQPEFQSLASRGILLDQYYALTHPSEPNYAAIVGGDFWGMANDNVYNIPSKWVVNPEARPYLCPNPGMQHFDHS